MPLRIDTEKLEWGLEKGIEQTDTPFASLPPNDRLRNTSCGLVSAALSAYAAREGFRSRLIISTPKLSFDPFLQHVVALVEPDRQSPVAIDASASQFLEYAGMSTAYESEKGVSIFPPEKVHAYDIHESRLVVEWLVGAVKAFRHTSPNFDHSYTRVNLGGPLTETPIETVRAAYESIYDIQNFMTWAPPEHVMQQGDIVSRVIPSGAIELIQE